jgi:hypothetical protein
MDECLTNGSVRNETSAFECTIIPSEKINNCINYYIEPDALLTEPEPG